MLHGYVFGYIHEPTRESDALTPVKWAKQFTNLPNIFHKPISPSGKFDQWVSGAIDTG